MIFEFNIIEIQRGSEFMGRSENIMRKRGT